MSEAGEPSRWTCEACGCHTNVETDRTCGICGTSRSAGAGLLRRRAPWLHHRAIVGIPPDADDDDVEDFLSHLHAPPPAEAEFWDMDDAESAIESLAMEVASSRGRMIESRERFLEAARQFGHRRARQGATAASSGRTRSETAAAASQPTTFPQLPASEMLAMASPSYQPRWLRPARGGRGANAPFSLEIGQGDQQNMAHVPIGTGEGRAIRAESGLVKSEAVIALEATEEAAGDDVAANPDPPKRNIVGFRVAFDHPHCEEGGNMGGGYLVGVTTSAFASYSEYNGLQQSSHFWGIDDSGKKYDGSRRSHWTLREQPVPTRRSGSSANASQLAAAPFLALQLGQQDVPMNDSGCLFGNREVVTVVCDLDNRVMAFWRGSTLLGSQLTMLPRTGDLIPVAVPYHHGSSVAITSLDVDPIPQLLAFAADWRRLQREKDEELRRQLIVDRGVLIENGLMTETLRSVLVEIFAQYSTRVSTCDQASEHVVLDYVEAARLWYRCGFKLSLLDDGASVTVDDFLALFEKICAEDDARLTTCLPDRVDIKIGDHVEVVDFYGRFGDASSGPLHPSERGLVVDFQNGANGETKSVRVLHNQRRWWYQPSAIVSESSGLIETPAVFVIRRVLRAHGYQHTTLTPLSLKLFRPSSCQVGDVVKPRKTMADGIAPVFGRVVSENPLALDPYASRSRSDSSGVLVEFADRHFAEAVGCGTPLTSANDPVLETRRMRHSKLAHCTPAEIIFGCPGAEVTFDDEHEALQEIDTLCHRLQSEISALSRLDRSAIEIIARECKKPAMLASLFSAGLPEAMMSAIDVAQRQMTSLEPKEDLPEKIRLIGNLALVISKRVFSASGDVSDFDDDDDDDDFVELIADADDSRPPPLIARRIGLRTAVTARQDALDEHNGMAGLELGPGGTAQQRRSMLLALMSRARRSSNQGFLFSEADRESLFGGELGLQDMMPPSFSFGAAHTDPAAGLSAADFFGRSVADSNSPSNQLPDDNFATETQDSDPFAQTSFLDTVLRNRTQALRDVTNGAAQVAFLQQIVGTGILFNDLTWIKASVEAEAKKFSSNAIQKTSVMLRDAVDDEGMPLLLLAVSLGCSSNILNYLITKGARATYTEVRKAANTNQAISLRLLLQHTSSLTDRAEMSLSSEVVGVFREAEARQEALHRAMHDKAGTFIVALVQRLFQFGLALHRRQSPRVDLCSRVLSEVLVGNVLLDSLRRAQGVQFRPKQLADDSVHEQAELSTNGLLGSFPRNILGATILSDAKHLTSFLALVEDYLCSKDKYVASAGLSMLHTLLKSFPSVRGSSELHRFGMLEKVSLHLHMALKRLGETLTGDSHLESAVAASTVVSTKQPDSVICCPKKHTAVIHITEHNSFRCDICGIGVERGRPMHGCRKCDWDACENCTDKSESGTVKSVKVKTIALECRRLLLDVKNDELPDPYAGVLSELNENDNTEELQAVLKALLDRDAFAVQRLGEMLLVIGSVTIHQFETLVLPALFACLSGLGHGQDDARAGNARRKKRARVFDDQLVLGNILEYSLEERLCFAKQVVRLLFSVPKKVPAATYDNLEDAGDSADGKVVGILSERWDTDHEFTCSNEAQEVLRRCHQLLSFHENVSCVKNLLSENGKNQGELSLLTTAIAIQLAPSEFESVSGKGKPLFITAQPLVAISELQALVLRSHIISDPSYICFARQLAEDHAVIVERLLHCKNSYWRIGIVLSFEETEGTHTLRYASDWKGDDSKPMEISMSSPLALDSLVFGDEVEDLVRVDLAARSYYIISRLGHNLNLSSNDAKQLSDQSADHLSSVDSANDAAKCTLTRTWSALSLADAMRPADLKVPDQLYVNVDDADIVLIVMIGDKMARLVCESLAIETPPELSVSFSAIANLCGISFKGSEDTTLMSALSQIFEKCQGKLLFTKERPCQLFYSVTWNDDSSRKTGANAIPAAAGVQSQSTISLMFDEQSLENRSRKLSSLSSRSLSASEDDIIDEPCDGFETTSLQCMKVINLLRVFTQDASELTWNEAYEGLFVNSSLSKKLTEQMDVAVAVVSNTLPSWCVEAPSLAPSVFSYEARRTLLERVAFGISRSTLKQQEAKVNVGRLRQRMTALRARAVELVGEAFSGGADDPTALQLQADELYGMEEALAARVKATFRAAKWEEHTLQVAKASIRREQLLADAAAIMHLYASDKTIYHRRLEIRFEGESGFDLASGTEAGVTRGFYADVAECLLATENVAGVNGPSACSDSSIISRADSLGPETMQSDSEETEQHRKIPLPLWIPDLDASGTVIIPTPRADLRCNVGVFPRPLPTYHPLLPDVLQRFRFIGRLFAAAIRDNFVFPLPLSPAFIKLVLHGKVPHATGKSSTADMVLTSQDLPRPGFLGGEVYAAEFFICRALDIVDTAQPPLSRFEQDKRYQEISSDVAFARVALGKAYDCSFEDYFQDRTFVDPLDPAQDESAMPLCLNGHEKRVSVYNVREWVSLVKRFVLCDGIILQACAFREGIEDFFSTKYLRIFTPEELHRDVCGGGDGVEKWNESAVRKLFKLDGGKEAAEALVAVAAIGGEGGSSMSRRFGPTSPTIGFLIKALLEGTPQQRRQFLNFVTSVPIETPGRIEVVPLVSASGEFLPMRDPGCLPRANTCARRLYLPKFASYDDGSESFKEVFWAVIEVESKFKGFYEWRG
ncbi:hypothetical protein MPSEU_000341400 [Mayamaea pseudoterrestris]|nr:hypothetical protein MPSEU_000341400 [Mayamaea pseudoterrestris]